LVLLPIIRKDKDRSAVLSYTERLARELSETDYHGRPLAVETDNRDTGGARGWDWIKKGIPLRVEIGPRDIAEDAVYVGRRDRPHRDKTSMARPVFIKDIGNMLDDIQGTLFARAKQHLQAHTVTIDSSRDFRDFFTPARSEKPEIHGGFALSHFCGRDACEQQTKEELGVTIRCIPFGDPDERGECVGCGGPSDRRVVYAKAY